MGDARFSDGMVTGVPDVDEQHRDLFDALERIGGMGREGADPETLDMALADFREHVARHFAWEESYMAHEHVASLESHRTLHEILLGQYDEMMAELRATRFSFFEEALQRRFMPWLVEHIVNVDTRLAEEKKA
jgi:hemerythrin